jgi:hypothetical protein
MHHRKSGNYSAVFQKKKKKKKKKKNRAGVNQTTQGLILENISSWLTHPSR